MSNHRQLARRFIAVVERQGGSVTTSYAQTGTIYVTVSTEEDEITVRFANHGECYCREDISVDPMGCTYEQAIRATMNATGIDLSRSLRASKAANDRREKERAEYLASASESLAKHRAWDAERLAFQKAYLAEKIAGRPGEEISKKALGRYRAAANKLFEQAHPKNPDGSG